MIANLQAGSGCGWGSFFGGFTGACVGNCLSQPRQVVVQQPASTVQRELIIQQPVYQNGRPKRAKQHHSFDNQARIEEAKARQEEAAAQKARADAERAQAELELHRLKNKAQE